jgi:hypothetical protein
MSLAKVRLRLLSFHSVLFFSFPFLCFHSFLIDQYRVRYYIPKTPAQPLQPRIEGSVLLRVVLLWLSVGF